MIVVLLSCQTDTTHQAEHSAEKEEVADSSPSSKHRSHEKGFEGTCLYIRKINIAIISAKTTNSTIM